MPPPNNLTPQLTSFIGRERQIADVQRLLSTSRLLTLTGPGGTGKTRLALQVASRVLDEYPNGVFFVNLAPVMDHSLLVSTIAQTLDVKEASGEPLIETLKAYLQGRVVLLLLDNFEHVLEAAPAVVNLLMSAPDLKVLVTSRELLHMQGEQQYQVPPLDLPDPQGQASLEALSRNEAVVLFVERARSAKSDFMLTDENASAVAKVCSRLDGLPLAIELAAARIRVLRPQALLSHLEGRLKLLTGGAHDLPVRQQTLRNTIDWSYNLLSEREKQLFWRMSVFQGGCTLQALEAVCNHDSSLQIEVLEGASALVDKNLFQSREGRNAEPRFIMLETIHEYARERLQESREGEVLRREHTLYFMRLAEAAEAQLTGAEQADWLNRLEEEHDNMRAALRWAKEHARHCAEGAQAGEGGEGAEGGEVGLRIAGALWRFWYLRGYFSEGREQLSEMLAFAMPTSSIASAIPVAAQAPPSQSSPPSQSQSLSLFRARALRGAGNLTLDQGDYATARSLFGESLSIVRKLGDKWGIAILLGNLGLAAYHQGDYSAARSLHEESLAIWQELGNRRDIAFSLGNLGLVAYVEGEYATARSLHEESLAIWRMLGDKWGIAISLGNLGVVVHMEGDYSVARSLHEESLAIRQELGDKWGIAISLNHLGAVAYMEGGYATARSLCEESLAIRRELGDKLGIASCLARLGGMAAAASIWQAQARAQVERGARLLGAAEALLEAIDTALEPDDRLVYERGVETASAVLGEEVFERARQEGRAMSMYQAIEYALEQPLDVSVARGAGPADTYPWELSRREVEVLRLLAQGLRNEQIAERLFVSNNTVRSHLYSTYSKLDVSNRGAAIRFANEHGLS